MQHQAAGTSMQLRMRKLRRPLPAVQAGLLTGKFPGTIHVHVPPGFWPAAFFVKPAQRRSNVCFILSARFALFSHFHIILA